MSIIREKSICSFDPEYLDVIMNNYNENSIKPNLSSLNQRLSNSSTKENAFIETVKIIDIYPHSSSIIKDNFNKWLKFALNYHQKEEISDLHFTFIGKLLSLCASNQEFHKIIVSNYLSKIIETCLSTPKKSSASLSSLKCLETSLKIFPKANIVYKKKLEIFLESFLDITVNPAILKAAAKCMVLSNQLGGSGINGSIHVKNYTDYLNKLMKTLNNMYDKYFNTIEESPNYSGEAFIFEEVSHIEEEEKIQQSFRRINNVTLFLTVAVQSSFPVKKCFNPTLMMGLIERGLSAHEHFDKNDKEKNLFINSLIDHQIKLLDFLSVFIICIKSNLIRFATIKILEENLKRSKSCNCYSINSMYTIKIYEMIQQTILSTSEQLDKTTYEKIIQYVLKDISYEQTSVVLKIDTNQHKSKKAKNKSVQEKIINSFENSKVDVNPKLQNEKQKICLAALNTLTVLLKKVEWNIDRSTIDVFYNTIAKILLNINVNVIIFPYTSKQCRVALYKTFVATFNQHYCMNLALATNILSLGECSKDVKISNICAAGLETISKIMQPINPSLSINQVEKIVERRKEFVPITCSKFMNENDKPIENDVEMLDLRNDNVDVPEDNLLIVKINDKEEVECVTSNTNDKKEETKLNSPISKESDHLEKDNSDANTLIIVEVNDINTESGNNKSNEPDAELTSCNNLSNENSIEEELNESEDETPSKKLKVDKLTSCFVDELTDD